MRRATSKGMAQILKIAKYLLRRNLKYKQKSQVMVNRLVVTFIVFIMKGL